jgi:hypothetical protein
MLLRLAEGLVFLTEGDSISAYYPINSKKVKLYSMICYWNKEKIKEVLKELNKN